MATRELPVSVALAALSAAVALTFGAVFASDAYLGPLLGAALLPHALAWLTRRVHRSSGATTLVTVAGLVGYADVLAGSPSNVARQLGDGWTVVRVDTVPLPTTAGAVLLAAIVVFVVGAVTDDLAFHRDGSMSPLAIAAITVIWLRAFGRTHGWVPSTVALGAAAIAFLAVQHRALLERRRTRIGHRSVAPRPGLLGGVVAAGVVATLIGSAVAPALPGGDHPLLGTLAPGSGAAASYQTKIAPLVDVGDQLRQGPRHTLFTVRAATPDYWRITALDQYSSTDGGQWTLNARGNGAVQQGLSGKAPSGGLRQTYRIGPLDERWMPAAFDPATVSRSDTLVVRASGTLVTGRPSVSGLSYSVDSVVPPSTVTAAQRAATARPVPAALRRYTALPSDVPGQIIQTARTVTAGRTLPYDQAAALRDFFRSSFIYDSGVTLGDDENAMVQFLNTRRGFCVQFAATYAVMARSLGIPARVAVGFTPGTRDASGAYVVTNDDAHAWPEIWLAGLGWTHLFDPTPRTNDPGASALPSEPPTVARPTPVTVPTTLAPSPSPAPGGSGGGSGGGSSPPTPTPNRVTVTTSARSSGLSPVGWVLVLVGLVAVGVLATVGVVAARKRQRRARRRSRPDPAEQVAGAWAEALDGLRAAGVGWPASLTPYEVAGRVPARHDDALGPPLTSLAGHYTAARYGGDAPAPASVDAAWADTDAVLAALTATLNLRARLRARTRVAGSGRQPEPAGWSLRRSRSTNV